MSTTDIPQGQTLKGAFATQSTDDAIINGPGKFAPSVFVDNGNATINADVVGVGSIVTALGANLTFGGSVGAKQMVDLAPQATITINNPAEFKGELGFISPTQPLEGPFGEYVDLVGLANAAGYSIKHDLLTITAANGRAIDTVHLQPGFTPQQVIADGGSVYLTLGYGNDRIPGGSAAGTILPQHP